MYMHIRFYDGSNPYVTFNKSAQQIKKIYKQFDRDGLFPLRAHVDVYSSAVSDLKVIPSGSGGYALFNGWIFVKEYAYFAHAVNALGRLSAKMQEATT